MKPNVIDSGRKEKPMKPKEESPNRFGTPSPCSVMQFILLLFLLPFEAWTGGVVTDCSEADLRTALAGGGSVTFLCDGTITLSNTIVVNVDTVLDGRGHDVTISGGDRVPVLSVTGGATLTVVSLTIANGISSNGGGGIYVLSQLNATNCTFHDNNAIASSSGGAIYNWGTLNASGCAFLRNQVVGAIGATGLDGTEVNSPRNGGPGGTGAGGAIYNAGTAVIERSLFATNLAVGGTGGHGGNGYFMIVGIYSNQTGGRGGEGGIGQGGALFNLGVANAVNCTFVGNATSGGSGGEGGRAGAFTWNPHGAPQGFPGGDGGPGGVGLSTINQGGGSVFLRNCTLAFNVAVAGPGGAPGSGSFGNPNGQPGSGGQAGTGGIGSPASLVNTLMASNSTGNGWSGLLDLGHNLSSDDSCAFTNTGSLNNIDPNLGLLADNGGPTLTIALLPGSPAIDAGDTSSAPFTDQRGLPRPAGLAADIGAFEFGSILPALTIGRSGANQLNILVQGNSNQWCRILASSNLSTWFTVATSQINSNGILLFYDNLTPGAVSQFYRVAMP
jgi:hypothetical protein